MPAKKFRHLTGSRVDGKYRISPIYSVFSSMHRRCSPKHVSAGRYFHRGILVSEVWAKERFDDFADWAFAHGYRQGLDLDRIDNDKGYSPENCQFITHKENCQKRDKARASEAARNSYRHTDRNRKRCLVEGVGTFETVTAAARAIGLSVGHVSGIISNYRDRHYGKFKHKIHLI